MNDILYETLKLTSDACAAAFKEGEAEGYRRGYLEAIAHMQKIINEQFAAPSGKPVLSVEVDTP